MRYRQVGSTGLVVSEICLGTMTFGGDGDFWGAIGKQTQDDANALVRGAFDAGGNFAAWQVMKGLAISEREHLARYVSLQMYYSIAGRDLEREVVPLAQDQKLAIFPWSPLAGGLLSGKFNRDGTGPDGSRRVSFDFPPVDKDRAFDCVDAMRPMAEARGCSVARIALAWTRQQPFVTSVIIGARRQEQLDDNLAAVDVTLSDEELARLDEVSALPPEYPGWMLDRMGADRRRQVS
ncbi:MAG: aldo/keto reductase [Myxococcota bacterium]